MYLLRGHSFHYPCYDTFVFISILFVFHMNKNFISTIGEAHLYDFPPIPKDSIPNHSSHFSHPLRQHVLQYLQSLSQLPSQHISFNCSSVYSVWGSCKYIIITSDSIRSSMGYLPCLCILHNLMLTYICMCYNRWCSSEHTSCIVSCFSGWVLYVIHHIHSP